MQLLRCGKNQTMAQIEVSFKLAATDYAQMEQVCSEHGLSMSEAFTLFAKKVGRDGRIPCAVVCDPFYSASNMDYLRRLKKRSRPVKHTLLSTTSSRCKRGAL